ncbi:MAG: FecR domain-containing protein [Tannerellaceae bacterium]|jgi:ferric-dicitrate binding protein FerR (iron transport regulator)|nr:FecR domain-containing protein [Tannerellaceae bacterium]
MDHQLIEKYLKGKLLPCEIEEVMSWIESNNDHQKEFMELRKLYDLTIWHSTIDHAAPLESRKKKISSFTKYLSRTAVVLFILSGTGVGLFSLLKYESSFGVNTITSPPGQRIGITLSDGTNVWLNSNSSIRLPTGNKDNVRTIELEGEAYFEVARDEKHPFLIKTSQYDITVLGTSFNLLSYKNASLFECSLLEGSVSVKDHKRNTDILLQTNEKLRLENGILSKTEIKDDDKFLWRKGIYSFRNEPLLIVFEHLSLLHEVTIELKNPQIGQQMCSGKFRNKDGIDHILSILQRSYQFTYERNEENNTYTIY